ncbi:hypothetical protein [Halomonas salinarum]|uniref:hypothetical protein n=1 Tax=Halomonas salinarum TaxID=1158993 RepID=UPI00143AE608|nr:hypothetical protein [Halomonas salinarum]
MMWHLIAAVFAGLGAAGIALLLRTLSGKRLPRWIVPAFGGLGMLAYQIHAEYTWFEHKQQQLPASAQVVSSEKGNMFWRPWTYVFPMTMAFEVIDQENLISRQMDDQQLVEFIRYRFEKQAIDRVTTRPYLMNCTTREQLPLDKTSGEPQLDELERLDAGNPTFKAVCNTP